MAEDAQAQVERFRKRYVTSASTALIDAEREVLDSDYRANGYTTRAQADHLGHVLGLGSGDLLLDIGAGCGWPGLYLARTLGCANVSIDPIAEGMDAAAERASHDRLTDRHASVRGRGSALPFRSQSFDGVVHGDLMC